MLIFKSHCHVSTIANLGITYVILLWALPTSHTFKIVGYINNRLIHLATVNHKDCHSNFYIGNWDTKAIRGKSENPLSFQANTKTLPFVLTFQLRMVIILRSHSPIWYPFITTNWMPYRNHQKMSVWHRLVHIKMIKMVQFIFGLHSQLQTSPCTTQNMSNQ